MAKVYTIDMIEGNSNLGVPMFSAFGKNQNYQYIAFSPPTKGKDDDTVEHDDEIEQI